MIISTLIIGFISYFALFHLDNPIHDFIQELSSRHYHHEHQQQQEEEHKHHLLLEVLFTLLEYIDGIIMRRICICIFFILPIIMEMRALTLLSSLVTEGIINYNKSSFLIGWGICWALGILQIILFTPMHFQIQKSKLQSPIPSDNTILSNQLETGVYPLFGSSSITLKLKHNISLFDVRIHSWIYLYALALLTTTVMVHGNQIHKPIILAAPFLLVSGSFLILSCRKGHHGDNGDDLFLNVLRRALKLTLFDVVQLVGEDVAEDDKLQLNMLTWIVDYWATNSDRDDNDSKGEGIGGVHGSSRSTTRPMSTGRAASNATFTPTASGNPSTAPGIGTNTGTFQSHERPSSHSSTSASTSSNHGLKTNNKIPFPSFINIDERARPAVLSYKKAVEEFPPSRNICIVLAMTKRCPAMLAAIFMQLSGTLNVNYVTIILLPMIILEWMRMYEWLNACYYFIVFGNEDQPPSILNALVDNGNKFTSLNEMEPMQILLSPDSFSRNNQGSSLQVWTNIKGSVVRLESSLTAVKCVQTANIASDVVFDVMSLAKFGLEVKSKGLPHGISLLAKDLFQFHLEKAMNTNSDHDNQSSMRHGQNQNHESYSKAAINIMNNSHRLSKNVSELFEEGSKEHNILHPIISGASIVIGKGWLWGKENQEIDNTQEYDKSADSANVNEGTCDEKSQENLDEFEKDFADMQYETDSFAEGEVQLCHEKENEISMQISSPTPIENDCKKDEKGQSVMNIPESLDLVLDDKGDDIDTITETDSRNNVDSKNGNHHGLNFLGAGLAVVAGAIVSGIAISKKNEENERKRNRRSNVTIEILDDE